MLTATYALNPSRYSDNPLVIKYMQYLDSFHLIKPLLFNVFKYLPKPITRVLPVHLDMFL